VTTRICLWSGPRNVSTALMYSFRQRTDTSVVDEPLYAHYLAATVCAHTSGHTWRAQVRADSLFPHPELARSS